MDKQLLKELIDDLDDVTAQTQNIIREEIIDIIRNVKKE